MVRLLSGDVITPRNSRFTRVCWIWHRPDAKTGLADKQIKTCVARKKHWWNRYCRHCVFSSKTVEGLKKRKIFIGVTALWISGFLTYDTRSVFPTVWACHLLCMSVVPHFHRLKKRANLLTQYIACCSCKQMCQPLRDCRQIHFSPHTRRLIDETNLTWGLSFVNAGWY